MTDNVTPINVAINTEAPTPARATLQDNLQLLFGNFFSSLANMITDEVEQRIKAAQVEKDSSAPAVPTVDELSESLMLAMQQAEWVKDLLANHVATQDFSGEISDQVDKHMRNVDFSDDIQRVLDYHDFSSDIQSVLNNYDFDEKIQEAIDNYDFSSDIERAVEDKMSEAKISVQF
jgi:hypothetical protein